MCLWSTAFLESFLLVQELQTLSCARKFLLANFCWQHAALARQSHAGVARLSHCGTTHIVTAGHPTQCQNSQGTIQQEEIEEAIISIPDYLSTEVAVLTKLILSVHLISF